MSDPQDDAAWSRAWNDALHPEINVLQDRIEALEASESLAQAAFKGAEAENKAIHAENDELRAKNARLQEALTWALGYIANPVLGDHANYYAEHDKACAALEDKTDDPD